MAFHVHFAHQIVFHIGIFGVHECRQPQPWLHVHPPAIKVEVIVAAALRLVGSIDADDIVVVVLDPDAPDKVSPLNFLVRNNVEDQRAHVSQEFLPLILKIVILLVEAMA